MNKKKITKIISFLLVLILLISFPLETQANAVAVEPWMVYALITYLAGMGITFTVAGGVDAMIQAMEEKVKDYEQSNNIIDFYDYMRDRNVRFVPNNNQDPNGNPFFDLFFTASAVEAIQSFANWLKGDGGWSQGYSENLDKLLFLAQVNGSGYYENVSIGTLGTLVETSTNAHVGAYHLYNINKLGTTVSLSEYISSGSAELPYVFYNPTGYDNAEFKVSFANRTDVDWLCTLKFGKSRNDIYSYDSTYLVNEKILMSQVDSIGLFVSPRLDDAIIHAYVLDNGLAYIDDRSFTMNHCWFEEMEISELTQTIDIITPEELQEQFPSVNQGVSIADAISVPMGDPSLIEWADRMEEVFIQTGTIPNPQPQIIQDPDYAPPPTPAPTPVPSPEIEDIEDLGLPTLGDAIFSKFPFSLPKDVGRIFQLLHAEPVTPYWQVDLTGDALGIPSNFEVDLAEYEVIGQITRWFSVVSYCLFLILITRGMIKW